MTIAKIVFVALLCVPLLCLWIHYLSKLLDEVLKKKR